MFLKAAEGMLGPPWKSRQQEIDLLYPPLEPRSVVFPVGQVNMPSAIAEQGRPVTGRNIFRRREWQY